MLLHRDERQGEDTVAAVPSLSHNRLFLVTNTTKGGRDHKANLLRLQQEQHKGVCVAKRRKMCDEQLTVSHALQDQDQNAHF